MIGVTKNPKWSYSLVGLSIWFTVVVGKVMYLDELRALLVWERGFSHTGRNCKRAAGIKVLP